MLSVTVQGMIGDLNSEMASYTGNDCIVGSIENDDQKSHYCDRIHFGSTRSAVAMVKKMKPEVIMSCGTIVI